MAAHIGPSTGSDDQSTDPAQGKAEPTPFVLGEKGPSPAKPPKRVDVGVSRLTVAYEQHSAILGGGKETHQGAGRHGSYAQSRRGTYAVGRSRACHNRFGIGCLLLGKTVPFDAKHNENPDRGIEVNNVDMAQLFNGTVQAAHEADTSAALPEHLQDVVAFATHRFALATQSASLLPVEDVGTLIPFRHIKLIPNTVRQATVEEVICGCVKNVDQYKARIAQLRDAVADASKVVKRKVVKTHQEKKLAKLQEERAISKEQERAAATAAAAALKRHISHIRTKDQGVLAIDWKQCGHPGLPMFNGDETLARGLADNEATVDAPLMLQGSENLAKLLDESAKTKVTEQQQLFRAKFPSYCREKEEAKQAPQAPWLTAASCSTQYGSWCSRRRARQM